MFPRLTVITASLSLVLRLQVRLSRLALQALKSPKVFFRKAKARRGVYNTSQTGELPVRVLRVLNRNG